jgi:hypothetical protein
MDRQRILLLEDDGALEGVLIELFDDVGLEAIACDRLGELQARVRQYPGRRLSPTRGPAETI